MAYAEGNSFKKAEFDDGELLGDVPNAKLDEKRVLDGASGRGRWALSELQIKLRKSNERKERLQYGQRRRWSEGFFLWRR